MQKQIDGWGRRLEQMRFTGAMLLAVALLVGCDYNQQTKTMYSAYESGHYAQAGAIATKLAEKADVRDRLILRLEQGAILRAAGNLSDSTAAFDQADAITEDYDRQPEFTVSQEALAASINQTARDYRGYAYDRIMLNTYKALNAMETGDESRARVELRRAYNRQTDAVDKYGKKIEADKKIRDQKKNDYDVDRANSDPNFKGQLAADYTDLQDFESYRNYVNPFTEYLQGLFLMTNAADASDMEQARFSLHRVQGMVPHNSAAKIDADLSEKAQTGTPLAPTTYVFFESGLAPVRDSIRIDIPLFLVNNAVDYIGVSFPKLNRLHDECGELHVITIDGDHPAEILCDMDKVVSQEFKNELPLIITRTLISAGAKAAAAYGMNEATRKDAIANVLTRVSSTVYQFAANQADLRTWKSLPKYFYVARLATPTNRTLTLSLSNGQRVPVTIEPGIVNVIYVKCVGLGAPPVVRQFKLK